MLRLKYGFIAIVFCVKEIFCQPTLYAGDSCTLESTGSLGKCRLLRDCPTAITDLGKGLKPQHCGFEGSEETICCLHKRPGDISKEKCREYQKFIYTRRASPIFGEPDIIRNECGHRVVELIVGGTKAGRKEFPHMASIGFRTDSDDIQWLCGGTIISERYILTAAHCLKHQQFGNASVVRLGFTNFNARTRYKQVIKISELIRYPEYKARAHYDDIALIKLEKPAKMSPYARPACLYLNHEINAEKAIATGWGRTDYLAEEGSNILLKVTLDLFDHQTCNSSYANYIKRKLADGIRDDAQVCAGSKNEDEEKNACQGDSGGPLQIYHIGDDIKCMYDIIGITSFGKGCSGDPGVFSRVSHYIEWIENIVWS